MSLFSGWHIFIIDELFDIRIDKEHADQVNLDP